MKKHNSKIKFFSFLFIMTAIFTSTQNSASAQNIPKRKTAFFIDFEQLVTSDRFNQQTVGDAIWSIDKDDSNGTVIIQIPIRVVHGDKPAIVSGKVCKVRGGKFLTVYIPDNKNKEGFGGTSEAPYISNFGPGGDRNISSNFKLLKVDPVTKKIDYSSLEIPRVTKKVTIGLDGKAEWDLPRKFDYLKISNLESFYSMKIDREILAAKNPEQADGNSRRVRAERRSTKGLSRAEKKARRDEANLERRRKKEREKQLRQVKKDYLILRGQVSKIPTKFTQKNTEVVWLVYAVPAELTDYEITVTKHKKWKISKEQLTLAMSLAKVSAQDIDPTITESSLEYENEGFEILDQIFQLSKGSHENDLTLAVASVAFNNALAWVDNNGYTPKIAKRAIEEKNIQAVSLLAKGLANIKEQTRTSIRLTKTILEDYSNVLDRSSLRHANIAVLSISSRATLQDISKLSTTVKVMLARKNSPEVDVLMQSLLDAWDKARSKVEKPRPRYLMEAFRILYLALDMKEVLPEKRDAVVEFLAKNAGNNLVPWQWVTEKLLTSSDTEQLKKILGKIEALKITATSKGDRGFGSVNQNSVTGFSNDVTRDRNNVVRRIFIYTAAHPIFNLLNHKNEEVKNAAWKALPNFSLIFNDAMFDNHGGKYSEETYAKYVNGIYKRFVNLAMNDESKQNVIFELVGNQKGSKQAVVTLMNLGANISGENGQKAAGAFWDIGEEFGEEFKQLTTLQKTRLLNNIYLSKKMDPPHVISYIAQKENGEKLIQWLNEIDFQKPLPSYTQWMKVVGGERVVAAYMRGNSSHLADKSAKALVQLAGGVDADVLEIKKKISGTNSGSEAFEIWDEFKQKLLVESLRRCLGKYTIYIKGKQASRTYSRNEVGRINGIFRSEKGLSLGVYSLLLIDDQLGFEGLDNMPLSLGEVQLAIKIENIRNLWTLDRNEKQLKSLALLPKRQIVNLFPRIDGSWKGNVLFENEAFEMILVPVKDNE